MAYEGRLADARDAPPDGERPIGFVIPVPVPSMQVGCRLAYLVRKTELIGRQQLLTWYARCGYVLSSTRSSDKGDLMKHTDAEIEDAARRFEQLADNLDPASMATEDLSDLRAVAEAAEQVRRDEALVTERVAAARARGRSWNRIAVALGVSRQAARHRFAGKVG